MKATQQAQLGYYQAGREPPMIHEDEVLYVCWSEFEGFRVFDRIDDRLVETFVLDGLQYDEAKAIAKAYIEDYYND